MTKGTAVARTSSGILPKVPLCNGRKPRIKPGRMSLGNELQPGENKLFHRFFQCFGSLKVAKKQTLDF